MTDNCKEFTDRLFANKKRESSGNHELDQLCQELRFEHRLTKTQDPQNQRHGGAAQQPHNGRSEDSPIQQT